MINIVVLIYSKKGSTLQLAEEVCKGIDSVNEVKARLRRVDELKQIRQQRMLEKYEKVQVITKKDITDCDGLILGSPTRFGNMAGELKYFIDQTLDIWISGELIGKPGAVFTSTGSLHGGQETTLLSMMLPLFHHGMLLAGIPYSEPGLSETKTGGTPYGASHVSEANKESVLSNEEKNLGFAMGARVAKIASKLS
ncbi:MAG: NAD(P)H:quinone oxidoreductase [Burkholderiaceae bacterium]|nr:MAG: NAD(P)H:quinone oxidoreductase [Burkholderiaceae bacterium]